MYCPKCGKENPDYAKLCRSCGQELTDTSLPVQAPTSKTSILAIVALVLGILSIALAFLTGIPAIICGIVALVKIKQSSGKLKGKGLAIAGIAISGVMSIIIVILIGLLVPALNMARRSAKELTQKNQLHTIGIAIEFFNSDFDGYPPSGALDGDGQPYCGALKLCEAMMGQDLTGFHPDSVFRRDGTDSTGRQLYGPATRRSRRELYLQLESANVFKLQDLYGPDTSPFLEYNYVLCDVYTRTMRTGQKTGMPILYYKAETSNNLHDPNQQMDATNSWGNIYNYLDNHALVGLGVPGKPNKKHPLFTNPKIFYEMTKNRKITIKSIPNRADSFILISAGKDGLYGTPDDIVNFAK